jgi:hypothetical protein
MINSLVSTFYNTLYRFKRPPMVKYWLRTKGALARIIENKKGQIEMQIQGEKENYPGFPRGPILMAEIGKLKHIVKTEVFNVVGPKIRELHAKSRSSMVPPEKMPPAVKEVWDTFEKMEELEVTEDMRQRIQLMKEVICFFLEADDAYRFRAQLFLDLINQKKVRLSKQDLYFARGKYWRPDRFKRVFGRWYDGYTY